jgi:hypothetical protein
MALNTSEGLCKQTTNSPLHSNEKSILQMFLSDPRTMNLHTAHNTSVHVAAIVKRGKVIAEASNRIGSRSSGSGYSKNTIHAEKNVVKALGDLSLLRGADMYIMRLTHNRKKEGFDRFMGSEPCNSCRLFLIKCIKEYGLKNVYWTA